METRQGTITATAIIQCIEQDAIRNYTTDCGAARQNLTTKTHKPRKQEGISLPQRYPSLGNKNEISSSDAPGAKECGPDSETWKS